MREQVISMVLAAVLALVPMVASAQEFVDQITSARTTQTFTEETVDDADLQAIVQAGLSATSAMNSQPWFFAVVTSKAVMEEISQSGGMPNGAPPANAEGEAPADMPAAPQSGAPSAKASVGSTPVAIVIYASEGGMGTSSAFDCGLACQNMVIAAQALGYGTKIVSSPTMALNGDNHDALCEKLGVDKRMNAVAVLLIGHAATDVDATSSATTRLSIEEKVSFVTE